MLNISKVILLNNNFLVIWSRRNLTKLFQTLFEINLIIAYDSGLQLKIQNNLASKLINLTQIIISSTNVKLNYYIVLFD